MAIKNNNNTEKFIKKICNHSLSNKLNSIAKRTWEYKNKILN